MKTLNFSLAAFTPCLLIDRYIVAWDKFCSTQCDLPLSKYVKDCSGNMTSHMPLQYGNLPYRQSRLLKCLQQQIYCWNSTAEAFISQKSTQLGDDQ